MKRLLVAIALLAFALLAWNFRSALATHAVYSPGAPERGNDTPTSSEGGAHATLGARDESSAASTPVRDTAKLPPEQAAFSDSYPELKRLADAGSPSAACRLAFELLRCQAFTQGPAISQALEQREALDAARGTAWAADASAGKQIEVANRTADCRKLPPGAADAASDYLYRAASAGNLAAQVRYIRGQMFGAVADESRHSTDLGYLHHPEFERWHRNAPVMARQLLASHPWVGAELMGMAYLSDDQVFDALVPDDELQAWAYNLAARDANGAPPMSLDRFNEAQKQRLALLRRQIPRLDPSEQERAAADAMVAPGASLGDWSGSQCSAH
jgi:hypothetical protein